MYGSKNLKKGRVYMGLRRIKRQMVKARMTAAGVGNVNKKMRLVGADGVPNWRKALTPAGEKAQKAQAQRIKRVKHPRRKLKEVKTA